MENILLAIHTIIALALVGIVIMQRSSQDGFGMGSGSGGTLGSGSGRAKANPMTRATAILAAVFMISSLLLVYITTGGTRSSMIEQLQEGDSTPEATESDTESTPQVPLAQ